MLRPQHGMLLLALGIGILGCQPQNIITPNDEPSGISKTLRPSGSSTATPTPSGSSDEEATPTPTPFAGAGVIDFIQLAPVAPQPSYLPLLVNYCLYMPPATDSDWIELYTYNYPSGSVIVRALRPELLSKTYHARVDMITNAAPPEVKLTMAMEEPLIAPTELAVPALGEAPATVLIGGQFLAKCPELAGTTITTETATESTGDAVRANGVNVTVNVANAKADPGVFRQLIFTASGNNLATASMRLTITNEGILPIVIQ